MKSLATNRAASVIPKHFHTSFTSLQKKKKKKKNPVSLLYDMFLAVSLPGNTYR